MSFRKNGVSEFQISNQKLVKYLERLKIAFLQQILSSFERH